MKSYSILSPNDGQLLIRFHDECVKAGMKSCEWWNKISNPSINNEYAASENRTVFYYCLLIGEKDGIAYHSRRRYHNCLDTVRPDPELINLTPENFDEVLKKVIENS